MKRINVVMAAALLAGASGVHAAQAQSTVKRMYAAPTARFASSVWAGDTLYVAGQMASPMTPADAAKGTPAEYGDTEAQTESALKNIEKILKANGLSLGDIVQMECFVAGDSKKDGKMDFAGLNAAYGRYFGTEAQPNRPTRAAVQVAGLATPWGLVEIVVVAVKSK